MSILFFYNGKYPDGMAMSNRIHLYGKSLMAAGMELTVVVPGEENSSQKRFHEEVPFYTIKNPIVFQNYILRQINGFWAAFVFGWYCYLFAKNHKVIFICGMGWFSALLAVVGGHIGGARMVLEVNENPYAPEGSRLDFVFIRKIRRWLMLNLVFTSVDGFIVISHKLQDLVARHKKRAAPILKIPILVDNTGHPHRTEKQSEVPYLLHTGALSETKDGVIAVFEAFAKASKLLGGNLMFYLTHKQMHPSLSKIIQNIIIHNQLGRAIQFTGYLAKKDLKLLRQNCTLAIVNKPLNWQNEYNFPTKLGEYLIDEIPVIVSSTGEMNRFLKDGKTAFIVSENDSEAMAEKIVYIAKHPKEAAEIGAAGRQLALKEFYFMNYADQMKVFFSKVMNR